MTKTITRIRKAVEKNLPTKPQPTIINCGSKAQEKIIQRILKRK